MCNAHTLLINCHLRLFTQEKITLKYKTQHKKKLKRNIYKIFIEA